MSFLPLSHHNQPASTPPPPPSLLPSALPETTTSAPTEALKAPNAIVHSDTLPAPTNPPPISHPQNFAPFFTLLSNTTSSTTHHPKISYIFSSDNPDTNPITAFALRSLDPASPLPSPFEERGSNSRNGVLTKERCILLDMDATGTKVLSAQSMSPDWAVTSTELAPAPTWDDRGGEEVRGEGEERGLMLRIEGMEVLGGLEGGDGGGKQKRLEELVDMYERRMGELRRAVDAGAGVGIPQSRDT